MRRRLVFLVDVSLVAAAVLLAVFVRDNLEYDPRHFAAVLPYLFASVVSAVILIPLAGGVTQAWRFSSLGDYVRICIVSVLIVFCALAWGFAFNRLDGVSRSLPILQVLFSIFLRVGSRVVRQIYYSRRKSELSKAALPILGGHETVIIIGLTRVADLYVRSVAEFAPLSVHIAGFLDQKKKNATTSVHQTKVLGQPEDVARVVEDLRSQGVIVDKIVVAIPFSALSLNTREALTALETSSSIKIRVLSEILELDPRKQEIPGPKLRAEFAFSPEELTYLQFRPYRIIKRVLDAVAAATLLVLVAPLMLLVAVVAALDVGFPVIFSQQRPGRYGVPISVRKFRTMRASHDKQGRRIPDEMRVSKIGRMLRRTRLDELPQLLSVVSGEMSFVGPRPLLPIDQPAEYSARLLIRPGLTGWAQVNGGRNVAADDKAAMDVWYARNASFLLDLTILLRTLIVVVRGERGGSQAIDRAWRDLRDDGIYQPHRLPTASVSPIGGHAA